MDPNFVDAVLHLVEGDVMEVIVSMAALAFVCLVVALGCALALILLID